MIPIQDLLFAIDTKVNSLANLKGQYIPDETKIEVLNKSQIKLVLKKLDPNNDFQLGMSAFNKRYQDLQILQVPYEKLIMTKVTGDVLNSYSAAISSLSRDMIVPVNAYVLADKGNCKNRIMDIIEIVKQGDLRLKLISPHTSPDFLYQETLCMISSDIFYVYSDSTNSFTIKELYMSYLRYPVNVDVAGYIHLDGTASTNVNSELDGYLANELLELAIEEIADATGNQNQSQLSRQRTKESE
jgi:hypothetical protein